MDSWWGSASSEGDSDILPTGSQGSHFQLVATPWHQILELKAGCIGVGLELLPFRRAEGAQTCEAEGMDEPAWLRGCPTQKEASRSPLAGDVHIQGWACTLPAWTPFQGGACFLLLIPSSSHFTCGHLTLFFLVALISNQKGERRGGGALIRNPVSPAVSLLPPG